MANCTIPLRNAQTARRRKASRRPRAAELVRTPEEMFPEILELPFCKYVGRPPGEDQCDWWSVPVDPKDSLGAEMLGRHYALLTAQFLHEDAKRDRPSILPRIIGAIVERGKFWGTLGARADKYDPVAIGFVNAIGDIMRCAYGNGTVNNMAIGLSRHYGACAEDARKGRSPKYLRKVLAEASETHRRFANESMQRDRGAP